MRTQTTDTGTARKAEADRDTFDREVHAGARFRFGRNWRHFSALLDEDRTRHAEASLLEFLGPDAIAGRSFLDAGSGSGLFSLVAARLGAARVCSFDYDPDSVATTLMVRDRFGPRGVEWDVLRGSVLDRDFLSTLGVWDIVYSWGVLHHTGAMWQALDAVTALVAPGGRLFISLYNDQGVWSRIWARVKRFYNRGPLSRMLVVGTFVPRFVLEGLLVDALKRRRPWRRYTEYRRQRGMSLYHDWVDWLGGWPFEVARPEQVFDFLRTRQFTLERLATCGGGQGCNQYVFRRGSAIGAGGSATPLEPSGGAGPLATPPQG